jgi:hypothetical protein
VEVDGYEASNTGTLRFHGKHHETGKMRYGVEMDSPVAKGRDGTFKGHQYFTCEKGLGVLVVQSKIRLLAPGGAGGEEETFAGFGASEDGPPAVVGLITVSVGLPVGMGFDGSESLGFFVTSVKRGGEAEASGQINVGQRIHTVNDKELVGLSKQEVVMLVKASAGVCQLTFLNDSGGYTAYKANSASSGLPIAAATAPAAPAAAAADSVDALGRLALVKVLKGRGIDYSAIAKDVPKLRLLVKSTAPSSQEEVADDLELYSNEEYNAPKAEVAVLPPASKQTKKKSSVKGGSKKKKSGPVTVSVGLPVGMSFDGSDTLGFFVTSVKRGGEAEATKLISVGQQILTINGKATAGLAKQEVVMLVKASTGGCELSFQDDASAFAAFKTSTANSGSNQAAAPPTANDADPIAGLGRLALVKLLKTRGIDYSDISKNVDALRALVRATAPDESGELEDTYYAP